MEIHEGDRVQIRNGGIDVTNGRKASSGKMYGDGGPLYATIALIDENWNTGGRYGLPNTVTKVRCVGTNDVVVWQVQPEDLVNIIRSSSSELVQTTPLASSPMTVSKSYATTNATTKSTTKSYTNTEYYSNSRYAPGTNDDDEWNNGQESTLGKYDTALSANTTFKTDIYTGTVMGEKEKFTYPDTVGGWRSLSADERKSIGTNSVKVDNSAIHGARIRTAWQNPSKKKEMLNEDTLNIQNVESFPTKLSASSGQISAKYDYRIIPGDDRHPKMITLEDKLKEARASLGIQVHGSNNIAKAVKYYMYNRFKTPDTNMAFNKYTTHVFFTRPDLNLLYCSKNGNLVTANSQVINHTEAAMLWKRHPELFKLLTDGDRCKDWNNFNMLLSNQVTSFSIADETLSSYESGKTWNEYSINYGDAYTGRTAGEFSCTFTETNDLSIISLLKLWITYIDNVARGAWSPSYDITYGNGVNTNSSYDSHVYTKTLDYAASAYVFKCGPDGEDVLYWSKYYGIFPVSTGASALSWDLTKPIGDGPNLNINFKYSFKRDLSPISLIEFNELSKSGYSYVNSYNPNYNHSSRPYVGLPYIEMKLATPRLVSGGVNYDQEQTQIRLKFRKTSDSRLNDNLLYKRIV